MKQGLRAALHDSVLQNDQLADLDPAERRLRLRALVAERVPESEVPALAAALADDIDGFGLVSNLMREEGVTDILINGPTQVWADRGSQLELTDARFEDARDLLAFVDRLVGAAGGRIDPGNPIGDVRLRDGSRMHVVMPPIAPRGPLVSIRRFAEKVLTLQALQRSGMFDEEAADAMRSFVREGKTILISGGTGSGKTTLLNALLGELSPSERVVIIEETPELEPLHVHAVSMLVRHANVEGKGGMDQETLLRAALRMRPDRVVVGEVRGPESLTALAAMSTGHEGSMASVHASSIDHAVDRMVALALQAPSAPSEGALRSSVEEAIDVYAHLERRDGERRLKDLRTR